ncbi:MAG: hypothetical protein FJ288_15550 [Planctomycetes bacterium]|nr:hypothetical protein [Planctomycetota bacterium]
MATHLSAIRGKEALLQKVVFEVRYHFGYAYLDNCGRCLNMITRDHPEWFIRGNVSPSSAPLLSSKNSACLNFSAAKYDLSIERVAGEGPVSDNDIGAFVDQADYIHDIMSTCLGLAEFARVGFRAWYLFGCDTEADAEDWLKGLACYNISDRLVAAFGRSLESSGVSVVVAGADRKYRIAFHGVQRTAQIDFAEGVLSLQPRYMHSGQREALLERERAKRRMRQNPGFAAMIDIDAYQENAEVIEPGRFVQSSREQFLPMLQKACEREG